MADEVPMNINVPRDLRIKINVIAKQQDTTVKAIVIKLVEDYIKEFEKTSN